MDINHSLNIGFYIKYTHLEYTWVDESIRMYKSTWKKCLANDHHSRHLRFCDPELQDGTLQGTEVEECETQAAKQGCSWLQKNSQNRISQDHTKQYWKAT